MPGDVAGNLGADRHAGSSNADPRDGAVEPARLAPKIKDPHEAGPEAPRRCKARGAFFCAFRLLSGRVKAGCSKLSWGPRSQPRHQNLGLPHRLAPNPYF
jgi:hypothetical protein